MNRTSQKKSEEKFTQPISRFKIVKNGNKLRRLSQDDALPTNVIKAASAIIKTPYTLNADSVASLPSLTKTSNLYISDALKKKIKYYVKRNALAKSKPKSSSKPQDNSHLRKSTVISLDKL